MKIMFVTSAGGHLAQLLPLDKWWSQHARSWVTFQRPEVEAALRDEITALPCPGPNAWNTP